MSTTHSHQWLDHPRRNKNQPHHENVRVRADCKPLHSVEVSLQTASSGGYGGTFFSAGPKAFSKTDLGIGPEESLNKYKSIKIISWIFSDDSRLKLELSIKEIFHVILQVH